MDSKKTFSRSLYIVFSIAAVVAMFVYFHRMTPFIYLTNDDLFLQSIASGEMTGTPDGHLYYVGYPVGALIALLYRILPGMPWYGLSLTAGIAVPLMIVLYALLMQMKTWYGKALATILMAAVTYGFLFLHIAELQFTTVTGMVGAAAVFLLLRTRIYPSAGTTLRASIPFLLMSFWAVSIRYTAFIMFFPIIGMIAIAKWLDAQKMAEAQSADAVEEISPSAGGAAEAASRQAADAAEAMVEAVDETSSQAVCRQIRRSIIVLAVCFFAVVALSRGVEKLAYSSADWQEFAAYTDASETIYDYDGYPDYEENRALYEGLGLTESSYEAAAHHYNILLEPLINRETMETLAEVSEETRLSRMTVGGTLKRMCEEFINRHLSYTDRPLNLLVYVLYAYVAVMALVLKKRGTLRDGAFLLIARMVIWAYLLYYGRLPSRVSQAVYLAELLVLVAIVLQYQFGPTEKVKAAEAPVRSVRDGKAAGSSTFARSDAPVRRVEEAGKLQGRGHIARVCMTLLLVVLLAGMTVRFGIPKAQAARSEAISRRDFSAAFTELKAYMASQDDRFFYLDMNSFGSFTADGLTGGRETKANFVFMGSWVPHSPWYDKALGNAGITDPAAALLADSNVRAVFMQTEATGWEYLQDFYEENYPGSVLGEVDTYTTQNGITFVFVSGIQ